MTRSHQRCCHAWQVLDHRINALLNVGRAVLVLGDFNIEGPQAVEHLDKLLYASCPGTAVELVAASITGKPCFVRIHGAHLAALAALRVRYPESPASHGYHLALQRTPRRNTAAWLARRPRGYSWMATRTAHGCQALWGSLAAWWISTGTPRVLLVPASLGAPGPYKCLEGRPRLRVAVQH